ncbi:maleylpyruvate isomerase N-terminal domain-containing protein [Plantactinospora sp. KBS50]|uniref:maleylpyruvate isomerase N-terminal domain-containing protein n=1 Tax=Plantactinospora sp. KBS50 TaxID=2024580 RepID=UPI001E5E3C2A|nr:maleylpyruvate isomerase N-terminal domain-containing protein [Plantactinospora sp. KBS50]
MTARSMDTGGVRAAFEAEARQLVGAMRALAAADFARPTACQPWTVADLLAHVRTATARLIDMLAGPAPGPAEVDAAGYYGPSKFTAATDGARVAAARSEAAAVPSGRDLVEDLDRVWRAAAAAAAAEPADRVVATRHGDRMELDEFLLTRVVELGVHGLDLAAALDRRPWLTEPAAMVIEGLLLRPGAAADGSGPQANPGPPAGPQANPGPPAGPGPAAGPGAGPGPQAGPMEGSTARCPELGWDRLTFIAKATGRSPLRPAERAAVAELGLRWLSFG